MTERLQAYTPTMAEVYRFMQSNPISSREMLDEISAESTPKSSWDMHLQSFIKLEKQCREIAEQIYDFIGESHNDADAELRLQEVSTNLAAFIRETRGRVKTMSDTIDFEPLLYVALSRKAVRDDGSPIERRDELLHFAARVLDSFIREENRMKEQL